jgi:nitrite reductase/ring-hydroxylating ferredoxin subunit
VTRPLRVRGAARLAEGRAVKFAVGRKGAEGFAVKCGGELRVFLNRCPHAGTPLDYGDGEFFTEDGKLLVCRTHGALFEPAGGLCVDGPCAGERLPAFRVVGESGDDALVEPSF